MIGAIIGDIIGSRFELHKADNRNFDLFTDLNFYTDDTVMTVAIAQALMTCGHDMASLPREAVRCMQEFGRAYPDAGYGPAFKKWLESDDPQPYGSAGNSAPMRVSPCGDAAQSLEEAIQLSKDVTMVTHDHPEGLKGAECVAVMVYLARSGMSKDEMRAYVSQNYYPLETTLPNVRAAYPFDDSSQGSVPQALLAFFEAESFEEAIRNAVCIGGDSDTLADIAGGVAGNYFSIPDRIRTRAFSYLPKQFIEIIERFEAFLETRSAEIY
ncbi:MAG: ADP-ribosylglycohydrolase [Clostridia bacterium]|nr:ADP-ribosylglycohydrolase [Clostridia bacterium]